jgi:hypothetical protein
MNAEFDYDLSSDQWETLKALRVRAPMHDLNRATIENLIALQLATMHETLPVLTSMGRKVLVRGSPRLWDVAA